MKAQAERNLLGPRAVAIDEDEVLRSVRAQRLENDVMRGVDEQQRDWRNGDELLQSPDQNRSRHDDPRPRLMTQREEALGWRELDVIPRRAQYRD